MPLREAPYDKGTERQVSATVGRALCAFRSLWLSHPDPIFEKCEHLTSSSHGYLAVNSEWELKIQENTLVCPEMRMSAISL